MPKTQDDRERDEGHEQVEEPSEELREGEHHGRHGQGPKHCGILHQGTHDVRAGGGEEGPEDESTEREYRIVLHVGKSLTEDQQEDDKEQKRVQERPQEPEEGALVTQTHVPPRHGPHHGPMVPVQPQTEADRGNR